MKKMVSHDANEAMQPQVPPRVLRNGRRILSAGRTTFNIRLFHHSNIPASVALAAFFEIH
jgi:hypothetical protein